MCGIIGYLGKEPALPFLLRGLKSLEYRGYDSVGVALVEEEKFISFRKKGKIRDLEQDLTDFSSNSCCGIGHTRWATHGVPSDRNAHPHFDCQEKVALVHNGIVENYQSLRAGLSLEGHCFRSDTDSEVIAHLLEGEGDPLERIFNMMKRVEGSYALCIIFQEEPDVLYGVRQLSPLILGVGEDSHFLASDLPAFLEDTRRVVFLEDGEVVRVSPAGYTIYSSDGIKKDKPVVTVPWDPVRAEKGGFKHFMLKEIHEQPQVLEETLMGRINLLDKRVCLEEIAGWDGNFERITIVACGTANYAGLLGKIFLEKLARIPVEVDYASEFRYRDPLIGENNLVIAISQSGETADTLAAVRLAKEKGARVLAICNVMGSTLTQIADAVIYTRAGIEIGVASTKAFLCQLAVLLLLALHFAEAREIEDEQLEREKILEELVSLPRQIREILEEEEIFQNLAREFYLLKDFLYLGRGVFYPLALEGALKLKEISYIHAEGLPAGEMKHGPIALIEPDVASVVLVGSGETRSKVIGNLEEIKARQGKVIAVSWVGDKELEEKADRIIFLPPTLEILSPFLAIVPLQLFAYYVALEKGCDVDQPRNLAKSVTVE